MSGWMARVAICVVMVMSVGVVAQAQKGRWASADDPIVKEMLAKETMWANGNSGPQPGLKDVIADEFQGTAPSGKRFDKASAIATDMNALDHDCQMGSIKAQF